MNDDQLANALRAAIPDAGFTARVERRICAERRRQRLARILPGTMAALGVIVAWACTSFSGAALVRPGAQFAGAVAEFLGKSSAPLNPLLSRYGLQPWMLAVAAMMLIVSFISLARDERHTLRF